VKYCPQCSTYFADENAFCQNDGAELKRLHDPYLGRTIAARYHLVKRLGSGGMSSVYLARHVMIERMSALKILRSDLARHPMHRERFLREARAVNRINHPNIVEISDLGEADGAAYLVMEFVDGPSLHEELTRGVLPWRRAARIALQVSAALARAHHLGVVHRDLKPENILLARASPDAGGDPSQAGGRDDYDRVKLTDFGIAKIMDEPGLTMGEQVFGTPGYIAPEYLEGVTADPRADLYSLGVILYEMTTGTLPYDERGPAMLAAVLRSPPVPPSRRVPAYPHELERLVLHLLARDPEERIPDAFAAQDALFQLLRGDTDGGPPVISATPDATRISFGAQPGVRTDTKTAVPALHAADAPVARSQEPLDATAEVGAVALPWHEAIAALEGSIVRAEAQRVPREQRERAMELVTVAHGMIRNVERASRAARAHQVRVDELEEEGRFFRAELGAEIDELVHERSRERAHGEAVSGRLAAITGSFPVQKPSDDLLWETAALSVASGDAEAAEEDLSQRIEGLQRRLHERNVALEQDVALASGELEGSLAAVRHLTHELQRALSEAAAQLGVAAEQGRGPAAARAGWRQG